MASRLSPEARIALLLVGNRPYYYNGILENVKRNGKI
jgi:hypothetical protein